MNLPSIPKSFFNGDCFDAYRILGAHPWQGDHGEEGWRFAVWAPGATAVEVCGGFDGWGAGIPLQKADTGVWSGFVSGLCEGELYKYRIHGADGSVVMRADPYAFASEIRPANASRLTKLDFSFDDSAWMERRDKCRDLPMNIYELHAGSWKHKPNSTQPDGSDGWYDYEELARELIPWLLEHHFTHVELLPLAEHPFDGSWGYQTTGYFAVTSRYGTPAQFASFVNACHRMGIGVIMDFVPVHFAANADALANFDGTHLYEYDSDVPEGNGSDAKYAKDNRENVIYTTYINFAKNGFDTTEATGWGVPNLNIVFSLANPSTYNKFVRLVKKAKLDTKTYEITSPSLTAYKKSIEPLDSAASSARIVLLAMTIVGGIALLALIVWAAVGGRRDEIGMAMITGVTKGRLGWQFMLETFMMTVPGWIIGLGAGALLAKPIGTAWAGGQAVTITSASVWNVICYGLGACLVLGIVAFARVACFNLNQLFEERSEVTA